MNMKKTCLNAIIAAAMGVPAAAGDKLLGIGIVNRILDPPKTSLRRQHSLKV